MKVRVRFSFNNGRDPCCPIAALHRCQASSSFAGISTHFWLWAGRSFVGALPLAPRLATRSGRRSWAIAALAFISPICALSVALFSARIGQHMILMLISAPLIGVALPRGKWRHSIWWSVAAFTAALWVWHMPVPYDATFHSTAIYWAMHLTLFGSAIWLWRDLLNHKPSETLNAIAAGLFACVQMGLLGAILCLSTHAWFGWYETTTAAWSLTQLEDQQLGGILMWVPSGVIFLAAAARSFLFANDWLERAA